jgi:hypothetical protein
MIGGFTQISIFYSAATVLFEVGSAPTIREHDQ